MPAAPRVSVVIATYNWSSALRCAIDSVLAQTFTDFELLVVGDGCSDDSAAVVAAVADPRVSWHELPERTGSQSAPNNEGVARARGDYVAYLGHDDLWLPGHLESLVATLDVSGADFAYAVAMLYGPPGSGVRGVTGQLPVDPERPPRFVPPSSWVHRRELLAAIGPWGQPDELTLPLDQDLLARVHARGSRMVPTGRLSVLKLPASWRPDVYRQRGADEQRELLRRMREEPDFAERELLGALAAQAEGRLVEVSRGGPPGPQHMTRIQRYKGSELPPAPGGERWRCDFDELLPGLAFHGVERHPYHGTFQWSGPGTSSDLRFNVARERELELAFRVLAPLSADVLDSLSVECDDLPVALSRCREPEGTTVYHGLLPPRPAQGLTSLRFRIARTLRPVDLDPASTDSRALGLPFNWLEVQPVAGGAGAAASDP